MGRRKHGEVGVDDGSGQDMKTADAVQADEAQSAQTDGVEAEESKSEARETPADPSPEDHLEAARAEAAGHYDKYVRARAELENVIKRHERDRAERAKYAVEPLARDLLDAVDDLERAREHAGSDDGALADGVRLVLKRLAEIMASHGIERVKSVGLPFDPNSHEAVAVIETDQVLPDHVVEEQRAGYRLKDRLLRPAMVIVAKAPAVGSQD